MTQKENRIFIIGHKNPDTDSICSAIGYAHLKNIISNETFVACRAGDLSAETQFVLQQFGIASPEYIGYVGTQVKDITLKPTPPLSKEFSLKKAWNTMRDIKDATMPVVNEGRLEGIISIKDIATANMDIYETKLLGMARTSYQNVLETIEGTMIVGDPNAYIEQGKILIGAANPDLLEEYIEEGDIIITGNRFENQLCAIEMNAGCIVVCMGAPISKTIQKLATENNCTIISTPHDTYMVARLINQSIPIGHLMRKDGLVTFGLDDYVREIKTILAKIRHRDFPILNEEGKYCGMISRRSLLGSDKKRLILVDHNEKSQAVDGIEEAELLEIIDHHRLGSLETSMPVYFRNQPVGCTATIIHSLYQENGVAIPPDIAGVLCAAILSDTLMFRSPTCTQTDVHAAKTLAEIANLNIDTFATTMFRAASNLSNKTSQEILHQDYKPFTYDKLTFGVGQVTALDAGELEELRERMIAFMQENAKTEDMQFLLLTNILTESSDLIFFGERARTLVEEAFGCKTEEHWARLADVVSRKKQFIPKILAALQQ